MTRDYVLTLRNDGAPLFNVFGGKITTYRRLSEAAKAKLAPFFPAMGGDWTKTLPLPGGDFAVDGVERQIDNLISAFPFLGGGRNWVCARVMQKPSGWSNLWLNGGKNALIRI